MKKRCPKGFELFLRNIRSAVRRGLGAPHARKTPQCGVFSKAKAVSDIDRKAPLICLQESEKCSCFFFALLL